MCRTGRLCGGGAHRQRLGRLCGGHGRRCGAGRHIWRAGDLAQHQPIRHRFGTVLVWRGVLGVCRYRLCAGQVARTGAVRHPVAQRHTAAGRGLVSPASHGVRLHGADRGTDLVPVPHTHRSGAAQRGRKPRIGARPGLSGAPHPLGGGGGGRLAVRARGRVCVDGLHTAVGGGHDRWQRLDRTGPHHLRHVAPGTCVAWGVSVWWRDHAAVPFARGGCASAQPVPDHDALCGHHRGAGADLAQPNLDPRQHAKLHW